MKQKTHKDCANPTCKKSFRLYRTTDKYCSKVCHDQHKGPTIQKPRSKIKPMGKKRIIEKLQYDVDRLVFLGKPENKYCKIKGPTCTVLATTIEHTRGRVGFADEDKRYKGISLYLDQEFWAPACGRCNTELENNTALSREHQLSKIHGGKKDK